MNRVLVHLLVHFFRICSDITAKAQSVLSRKELRYKVDDIAPLTFHVRIRTIIGRSKKVSKVVILSSPDLKAQVTFSDQFLPGVRLSSTKHLWVKGIHVC